MDLPLIEILDIGAMIEGEERYAPLVERGLANVTGVEPDPQQHAKLCAEKQGPYNYLPYFLGDGKPSTFHETYYPGCSSLYRPNTNVINMFNPWGAETGRRAFHINRTVEVNTKRLDDVKECPRPDYLKIDVQGAELDILENGEKTLSSLVVLESEVEFLPLYENQPLFADVDAFLRERGFVLHKFVDMGGRCFKPFAYQNNRFAAISQLLWADAVYVRDFTAHDRLSAVQLLKSAIILNDVYLSYDLVHLLLREYDRRKDTDLAARYERRLRACDSLPRFYLNPKERM